MHFVSLRLAGIARYFPVKKKSMVVECIIFFYLDLILRSLVPYLKQRLIIIGVRKDTFIEDPIKHLLK